MKSPCKNCVQLEVGCFSECADCRAYKAERKRRRIFGRRHETRNGAQAPTPLLLMPQTAPVTIDDLAEAANRLAAIPFTIRG